MKKLIFAISAVLISGSVLAAPSTATLVNANGSVMVNQGKQFVTAKEGLLLSTGDRVMVMEGAKASITYADGCVQTLNSGSLAVIAQQSVCASGVKEVTQIAPLSAQTVQNADCDGDGLLDNADPDIDNDDILNAADNINQCVNKAGIYNGTGIWVGALVGVATVALVFNDDEEDSSP